MKLFKMFFNKLENLMLQIYILTCCKVGSAIWHYWLLNARITAALLVPPTPQLAWLQVIVLPAVLDEAEPDELSTR